MTAAIIYLHGFLSSPASAKARAMGDYLSRHAPEVLYRVPALAEEPALALAAAEQAIGELRAAGASSIGLIGSSMGGFYATVLALRHGLRAALINPSVAPQRRIELFFGEQQNPYSGRRFILHEGHAQELAQMAPAQIARPELFWLLLQSGDEVLDYREALQFYAHCRQTVEQGGNHQFVGFERHLPALVEFLTH